MILKFRVILELLSYNPPGGIGQLVIIYKARPLVTIGVISTVFRTRKVLLKGIKSIFELVDLLMQMERDLEVLVKCLEYSRDYIRTFLHLLVLQHLL